MSKKSETQIAMQEKRKNKPLSTTELYRLPTKEAKRFISKERRQEEQERLKEVADQKRWWYAIVSACLLVNLTFLMIAFYDITHP